MTIGNVTGAYQSTRHLIEGCFAPTDLLGFAPAAGAGLRGLGALRPAVRQQPSIPTNGWRNLPGGVRIKKVGDDWIKEVNPMLHCYLSGGAVVH